MDFSFVIVYSSSIVMKTAVLIPCYNEALTIKKVIEDFSKELPEATIYVYDNNSSDQTVRIAKEAGAVVSFENKQGKGNVVRTMFREIDADIFVMVDGDDTYPAEEVHKLIQPIIEEKMDMVIGDRLSNGTYYKENKRPFHDFGNNLVRGLINHLFHSNIKDIMTGYRAFSRRFAKCMPVISDGFQIETEMTIFSLVYRLNVKEVPIVYRDRPEGSYSKLNTINDGMKVLITLFDLLKNYRPFFFFFIISIAFTVFGLLFAIKGLGNLSIGWIIIGALLLMASIILVVAGIILDAIKNQTILLFEQYLNNYEREENQSKNIILEKK